MRVLHRGLHRAPVLDQVERRVAAPGHPVPDDRPRPAVVDPVAPQLAEQPVDAVPRHQLQPPGDEPALVPAPLDPDLARPHQQVPDDDRRIVVVDVQRQRGGVDLPVVLQDVLVQEFQAQPLIIGIVAEFPLAGRGDRRVDEHQRVLARDQVREGLAHRLRVAGGIGRRPGKGGANCESSLKRWVRKSHRSPAAGVGTVAPCPPRGPPDFRRLRPDPWTSPCDTRVGSARGISACARRGPPPGRGRRCGAVPAGRSEPGRSAARRSARRGSRRPRCAVPEVARTGRRQGRPWR